MPDPRPIPLDIPAGVVKTESDRVIEGRWKHSQWCRFVSGRPEKRGGFAVQSGSGDVAIGMPRAMHAWRDLEAQEFIGVGTHTKLLVYDRSFDRHDITPFADTGSLGSNPFTTTNGSSLVTVADTSHGRRTGDAVYYAASAAVGGILAATINRAAGHTVLTTTANTYVIDTGTNATSGVTGGGASVTYQYEVNIGVEVGTYGLGYGAGGYGLSTYGSPRSSSNIVIEPRVWTIKNYGELLMAAFNGGSLYQFDPGDLATNGRAERISNAPTDVRAFFITEERFPFCLCEDMVVKWPDQDDFTDWTPSVSNTANTRRLTDGTKLVGGIALTQGIALVLSDNAPYLFQYTGSSAIYSSRKLATSCGLISPIAICVDADGTAYWMSSHSYHQSNGNSVTEIPNVEDIKTFVSDNLRTDQPYLCWAYYDPKFDEVTFFYVPEGSSTPELSITYHKKDRCWSPNDWSDFPRTAATRFQHGDTRPYLIGEDGYIYLHEEGYDADGAAIAASLQLAPVAMNEGTENVELDGIRLDLKGQVGDIDATFTSWDQLPPDDASSIGLLETSAKTIATTERLTDLRIAGRYLGLEIESDAVGGNFRWGKPVAHVKGGGRRR